MKGGRPTFLYCLNGGMSRRYLTPIPARAGDSFHDKNSAPLRLVCGDICGTGGRQVSGSQSPTRGDNFISIRFRDRTDGGGTAAEERNTCPQNNVTNVKLPSHCTTVSRFRRLGFKYSARLETVNIHGFLPLASKPQNPRRRQT